MNERKKLTGKAFTALILASCFAVAPIISTAGIQSTASTSESEIAEFLDLYPKEAVPGQVILGF